MKLKKYIFLLIAIIVVVLVVLVVVFIKSDKNQNPEENLVTKENLKTVNNNINPVFEQFAKDFNTHKDTNIDKYIDPKMGMMVFYHDGPYPIIQVTSKIGDEIDWFSKDIFTNIELGDSPNYLGDFEFSKTGFFVKENKGEFSLKDFDNSYTSHPDSFYKENKKLETSCNFSAMGITKDKKSLYQFYFKLDEEKLTLLGLSVERVSDIVFGNPEAGFIPFDTKKDIEDYFKNQRLFRDKEQNAYIDFDKKQITYYDFPNENPFIFEYFEIGDIVEDSDKIKSAEIIFYTDKSNKENGFITYFSNKGSFAVAPMGARPPYLYEPENK